MNAPATESSSQTAGILFIGYGNELRGDDGAGRRLVDRIESQKWDNVDTLSVGQLTPDLAARLANRSLVVFADALAAPGPRATVQVDPVKPVSSPARSHHCTPGTLLALAERLYRAAPVAAVITIPGQCFDWNENLSGRASANVQIALNAAEKMIQAWQVESID